jgi:hypothetical protein
LPVIVNAGVGDVAKIVSETGSGHVLPALDDRAIFESVQGLDCLMQIPPERIRTRARAWHDLPLAKARYVEIYRRLQGRHGANATL